MSENARLIKNFMTLWAYNSRVLLWNTMTLVIILHMLKDPKIRTKEVIDYYLSRVDGAIERQLAVLEEMEKEISSLDKIPTSREPKNGKPEFIAGYG